MLLYIAIIALFGLSVFFLTFVFCGWKNADRLTSNAVRAKKLKIDSIFVRIFWPLVWRAAPVFRRVRFVWYKEYISRKLLLAGLDDEFDPERFLAYQILMGVLFQLIGFFILPAGGFLKLSSLFLAGFFFPLLWLFFERKKRIREILLGLPFALDMLTLSVEAGLDFMSALVRIVERSGGSSLISEFKRMLANIKLGKSRTDALMDLKTRIDIPAVDSFVSMLVQAQNLGASIGPVLKAHAQKLRSERFQAAERAGVIAAQKVLVPLVFFIMPAVFIVIFGPLYVMLKTGAFERMFY